MAKDTLQEMEECGSELESAESDVEGDDDDDDNCCYTQSISVISVLCESSYMK